MGKTRPRIESPFGAEVKQTAVLNRMLPACGGVTHRRQKRTLRICFGFIVRRELNVGL